MLLCAIDSTTGLQPTARLCWSTAADVPGCKRWNGVLGKCVLASWNADVYPKLQRDASRNVWREFWGQPNGCFRIDASWQQHERRAAAVIGFCCRKDAEHAERRVGFLADATLSDDSDRGPCISVRAISSTKSSADASRARKAWIDAVVCAFTRTSDANKGAGSEQGAPETPSDHAKGVEKRSRSDDDGEHRTYRCESRLRVERQSCILYSHVNV